MTKQILVLGSVNADHVLKVDAFPRPGETVTGSRYDVIAGGKGANQAVASARLGGNTHFLACVGQDAFGREIVDKFAEDGIDTSLVEQVEGVNTGVALIFVDGRAENCIGIAAEANAALTPERVKDKKAEIAGADYLLMQLETPEASILEAAKVAQSTGVTVVLNPAPARPLSDELLASIDMITPNQTEAELLTGVAVNDSDSAREAATILHEKGISRVVITMGRLGAFISDEAGARIIPSFEVSATDTTAAGDTFNGALLVKLAEGESIDSAARFANAAAGISVTRSGAQTSIPGRNETELFLAERIPHCNDAEQIVIER
ncbi:ribokinase [Endozoicomonas arenosclerae]|uniref:ribokinase n=1 Tax=Endozoicomonas arenosclerae TaxID=1633495 RepID=UPI0007825A09|nr:ribokinase [Endozoicomonas arenosclerae]